MPAMAGAALLLLLLLAWVAVRLWREQQVLKRELTLLAAQLQRGNSDVAALCSAAVVVDKRLAGCEARLNDALENIRQAAEPVSPLPSTEQVDPPEDGDYQHVIEQIRQGKGVEDLVKQCGLTRDEAMLLFRLHKR